MKMIDTKLKFPSWRPLTLVTVLDMWDSVLLGECCSSDLVTSCDRVHNDTRVAFGGSDECHGS